MADPRFFDNRGPFTVAELCAVIGTAVPESIDGAAKIFDVAGLAEAGPQHISFYSSRRARHDLASTRAGWCLVGKVPAVDAPAGCVFIPVGSVPHAFAAIAEHFYPDNENWVGAQAEHIHPTARLGEGVVLAPGVVVGPNVEIGRGSKIGANTYIGRGVAIGRNCVIAANVSIAYSFLGDEVVIQAGAAIGGSGFGFASAASAHTKIPQLGRVILQDRVEIGANSAIDRGALADTVVGEGTKIDNLVQIGHNTRIGRHCVIVGQVGISGSVTIKDFAVLGGMAGIGDHLTIGEGTRVAGMTGVTSDLEDGKEYAGIPARPGRTYLKEVAMLSRLVKSRKTSSNE